MPRMYSVEVIGYGNNEAKWWVQWEGGGLRLRAGRILFSGLVGSQSTYLLVNAIE